MRKITKFKKSTQLLLALLTLLAGGASPAWAQKALPYSYGFEDYNLTTDGWTTYFGTNLSKNNNECKIVGDAKKTGSYGFRFSSYQTSGANAQYLISPAFNAPNGISVSFYYKASDSRGVEKFQVGYSTTDTDVASFTWGDEYSTNSTSWLQYENSFPAGTKYVAIYYYSNYQYRLYVDDFSFTSMASGPALAVADGNITINSGYTYNFGLATAGTTHYFTLSNPGTESVTLNIAATNGFGISNNSLTLEAKDACLLTVTMPDATATGTVTITPTASEVDPFTINVSGTIADPNKVYETLLTGSIPEGWTSSGTWTWSTTNGASNSTYYESYNYRLITPKLTVADGETFFFDARGTYSGYQGIKFEYSADGTNWIASGTTTTLTSDWQTFVISDIPAGSYYIALHGWQCNIRNFYGGQLPIEPKMVVTQPASLDFGIITEAKAKTFTIANTGKGELTGLSVTPDNENFTVAVADNATTIAANSEVTFTVTMNANVKGMQSGKITVKADGFEDIEFNVSGYVVDESKFYVTFDDNQQPEGWSENTGWTFANGNATPSTDAQITLPALTVAEGEKMAISVEATASNPELFYYTSTDGGSTWSAKSANLASGVTTTAYSVVYIDGLEADDYKLKLQGYHIQIDALNGFTINANAPELFVTPTDNANFGTKIKAQPADKTYTIVNTGTGTLTGTITSSVTEHFTVSESEFSLAAGESITFNIALVFDENYGAKASTITIHPTNDGLSDVVINATATTADPNVWEEDFAAGIPATWINENNAWTTTRYGHDGQAGPGNNNTATLTTPRLEATQDQVLTFDVIDAESETYFLKAEYSTDRKSWTLIENYTTAGSMSFTAPEDGYYYLRFTGNYTYVDNFYGFKEAPLDHDAAIAAIDIPTTGNQYVAYTATVTVKEMAGKAEELTAKFFIGETQYGENVVETIAANGTKTFSVVFAPEAAVSGEAYFTLSNDDLALESNKTSVEIAAATVLAETVAPELTDGDAASVVVTYTAKAGWNTICMPFKLTSDDMTAIFGENWKAYEFTSFNDSVLGFSATTTFFAGYPYLVYSGTPANTQLKKQNVTIDATVNNDERGTVTFQGTYAPMAAGSLEAKEGKIKYVVGTIDGKTKLYKATATTWMKGFRAYFDAPDNTQVKSMSFFDEATGVRTISAGSEEAEAIFDLMGRRMNEARKGVNIVNGKKVIIK